MKSILLTFFFLSSINLFSQDLHLYKEIDTVKLYLEVYPSQVKSEAPAPAMVFFFGGGWVGGTRNQFEEHAKYFSKRGITCFLADYRVRNKHKTPPFNSLMDAKSAIRHIRGNAKKYNIDPSKIIASGGSAGGHLAAATAIIEGFNDPKDDLLVSCLPQALVLFNPVIDNGPGGYGNERLEYAWKDFSPLHNIDKGVPPTIFFLGTEDKLIPVATGEYYKVVMEKVGSRCDLHLYDGEAHGFFNYWKFDNYKDTVEKTDKFLVDLGYLKETPKIDIK